MIRRARTALIIRPYCASYDLALRLYMGRQLMISSNISILIVY
jgi:hypothetical protein